MNVRRIIRVLAPALCAAVLVAAPAAQATPDSELAEAEYEAMLEEAERARIQAQAARREAENAARRAQETAQRHAERARLEVEEASREAMEAAKRAGDVARAESDRAREAAEQDHLEGAQQRRQAEEQRARERAVQREEMERIQEELSRAHRELREATREIARAHREVARNTDVHQVIREINLGERAVIGVILGAETPRGVKVVGVSPGGPAEKAGLQAGDIIVSIRGETLGGERGKAGRETLYTVMGKAEPGETLPVVVDREGESRTFDVTAEQREPSVWQTMIRIPEAPGAPGTVQVLPSVPAAPEAPGAPSVIVEHIEVPDIDEDALNERIQRLSEELEAHKFTFVSPDGETFEFNGEFPLHESFDVEVLEFSELAEQALREANVWFGLPQAQGLELARVNEGLGAYFKTDRGVLVLEAREDNAYQLQSGDVVLDINSKAVSTPTDMIRALREIEPGSEVRIAIKRDRKDKLLDVVMPENRLGYSWSFSLPDESGSRD